jgi:uncharacterized membrane protein
MSPVQEDKSLKGLFADLNKEITTLFRQEIALAKSEISEDVSQVGNAVVSMAAGGLVAFVGVIFIIQALVLVLARVMPGWLAAFIVGAIVVAVGIMLLYRGRNKMKMRNLMPRRSMDSLQRDKQMAKEHM